MATSSGKMIDFTAVLSSDLCTTRMATMWQHQQDGQFTDLIIKVKDKSIPCHRVVLSAACDYFATVLTTEFNVKNDVQIDMEDIDAEMMANIINYCYGQNAMFNMESVSKLLDVMELLQLKELKYQLEEFMVKNISVDCCMMWWKLSCKFKMDTLRNASIRMMSSDITVVGGSDEFKQLNAEELLSLIKDKALELKSQNELLVACVEWVDYEPLARKDSMVDIIKNINLENCSLDTLKTIDKKYRDLIHDVNIYRIILDAIYHNQVVDLKGHISNARASEKIVLLGGMKGSRNGQVNLQCYVGKTLDDFEWEAFAAIPPKSLNSQGPIICYDNGFVVLCGGPDKNKTTKYDARLQTWSDLPDSPVGLVNASAVMCDKSVYLLGGYGRIASVYALDLPSLTWSQKADMLKIQAYPIAASLGNQIYVVYNSSTYNGIQKPISLQEFAAHTTEAWQYKSSLPNDITDTWGASLVSTADALYLVGGSEMKLAAKYSINEDAWTLLKPPSIPHNYGCGAYFQGKIYLIGNSDVTHSNASVYDREK